MKRSFFTLSLLLLSLVVLAQTPEEVKKIVINPDFSLELTDKQYKQLKRHFKVQERTEDWARYSHYEEKNKQTERPKIVFMGNSITRGWYAQHPEFFEENNYAGRGIGGQTTYQMLARFQSDVVDLHPKAVVILAGTNDLASNCGVISPKHIVQNIKSMCEIAKANKIRPILCSVLPVYQYNWNKERGIVADKVKELNALIEAYAKQNGITYVDYYSALVDERGGLPEEIAKDGVHPNMNGYTKMEATIRPILQKIK